MPFNEKQIKQLLKPVNPKRVLKDGKGNAHLPAHDVIAHLNRVFGFGGFDIEVLSTELIFEQPGSKPNRFDVCYKAFVRLTVKDELGETVCVYEDGSTGSAQNQARADAHDLSLKSAVSLAIKRCAKDLGDGFGISLYDKGRMTAVVKATLVGLPDETVEDVQADVEQVESMGNDEIDTPIEPESEPEKPSVKVRKPRVTAPPAEITPGPVTAPQGAAGLVQSDQTLAIGQLIALSDANKWDRNAVNAKYIETYKVPVKDGTAEDLSAFHALLKTGAITLAVPE